MNDISSQGLVTSADSALDRVLALADADPNGTPSGAYSAKRVADVLLHLHAWHLVFATWMAAHHQGETPVVPAEGHTWADLDAMNHEFYVTYRDLGYDEARVLISMSHRTMCEQVLALNDADLAAPGAFPWLGDQRPGDVIYEFLAGHYEWAVGVLRPQ